MKKIKSEFDGYVAELLRKNKEFAKNYAEALAELPLTSQINVIRRHQQMTQQVLGDKMRKPQSRIAEMESKDSNPSLRILEQAAEALECRIVLVPVKKLNKVARLLAA